MRRASVLVLLVGCGFEVSGTGTEPTQPDAPPLATCDNVTCGSNASCDPVTTACGCNAGYSGDGVTCVDIDECVAGTSACPAACANTVGAFECYAPALCSEVAAKDSTFVGGDVTLYLGGQPSQPWTAFCVQRDGAWLEYLTVEDATKNFGQYTKSSGSVRTSYTRLRFDPVTMTIDNVDQTYATSTGTLMHGTTAVTAMPLGVAMDCAGGGSSTGVANIDLSGTPFVVVDPFEKAGNAPGGTVQKSSGGRAVAITGGGNCGYNGPAPIPFNPFNQVGGKILDLSYAP